MRNGYRLALGLTLLAAGVAFGILRWFGYWGDPLKADGGLLVVLILLGFGMYLTGTAVDAIQEREK